MQHATSLATKIFERSPMERAPIPRFSLILATCGRTSELHCFFASLDAEMGPMCECIVVDQNPDERLQPVLAAWEQRLSIRHVRSSPGLSRARNVGLELTRGEIVAFPDDDCWYSPNLLSEVARFFAEHPDYRMLSVGVRDEQGIASGNRWVREACDLTTANLFRTSVGMALFLRRGGHADLLRFDESLGVGAGTPFASGEDTDFVFRLLETGLKGRFERGLTAYHPRRDMLSGCVNAKRAYGYGCGMGRVIRQRAKLPLLPAFVAFDLLRMTSSLVRGKFGPATLCLAHGRGVVAGYVAAQ
jgi:glycosyltransferase involved in cell wall biosynthesis